MGTVVCKQYLGADADERRQRELHALSRLAGLDGVVSTADADHAPDTLVLRDIGGLSLEQFLPGRDFDAAWMTSLALRLARTLADVHRAGVIHCDVNPANIVMGDDGTPVLIDFDTAVMTDSAVDADRMRGGTPGYAAPEQTGRTGRVLDCRVDLYALGATLYRAATGHLPFESQDPLGLLHQQLVRDPPPPAAIDGRISAGMSNIILRLLAKEPGRRYQSADGLLHDLARLREEQSAGGNGDFALGERDFPARLPAPTRLIGRDAELQSLRTLFANALGTPRRMLLIDGSPGVGKSALVQELRPLVNAADGWFAYGKFDQYQRESEPGGGLAHAIRTLGKLLLAQPAAAVSEIRARILARLERDTAFFAQIPEFSLLLDIENGDAAAGIDPAQGELRHALAIVDLLAAIASPGRPLVLVLDDLQWTGSTCLSVLERIASDTALRNVAVVGIYRTEEVTADSPLGAALGQWDAQAHPPWRMTLRNLEPAGVREFAQEMLRLPIDDADSFAQALVSVTRGNPFGTAELIHALRESGALRLGKRGWLWEDSAFGGAPSHRSVGELMAARVSRAPAASRRLLDALACLGGSVAASLLAWVTGMEPQDADRQLQALVEEGFLSADPVEQQVVRFRHDHVQQAVLDLLHGGALAELHLMIGRRLLAREEHRLRAAQQLVRCSALLDDGEEKLRVARLFHETAKVMSAEANYLLAERYLDAASRLLASLRDPQSTELCRALDEARHVALYSLGRLEEADAVYSGLLASSTDPLGMLEPTCLQMRSLDMRGRMTDSMDLGRNLLAQLGLNTPPDNDAAQGEQRLAALDDWLAQDRHLDHARRSRPADARIDAIAKLLSRLVRSAQFADDIPALVWLLLQSHRLWIEHGPSPALVESLCRMGTVLINLRQMYRGAFEFVRHIVAVGDALGYEPHASEAWYMFSLYCSHWLEPIEDALRHGMRAAEGMRARGNISYASYVHRALYLPLLDGGPTLDAYEASIAAGRALARRSGNSHADALNLCDQQLARALRGLTRAPGDFGDEQFDVEAFEGQLGKLPYVGVMYYLRRSLLALLVADVDGLVRFSADASKVFTELPGYYGCVHAHLFIGMSSALRLQSGGETDRSRRLDALDAVCTALAARAADQPVNFLHLLRWMQAEQAWARRDMLAAALAFDVAMNAAADRERPWHKALIVERAARFHLAAGMSNAGQGLLVRARDLYRAWGATAKVRLLEGEHTWLAAPSSPATEPARPVAERRTTGRSDGMTADALDLMGLLQASQALSSETSLGRLTSRVTDILAGLTGATRVALLSRNDDDWYLLQPADEPPMTLRDAAARNLLPLAAVGYAERTGEPLVVDDTSADDRFSRDPYCSERPRHSMLIAPIAHQGVMRAMLVLENSGGRAAFNAQRLDAVMLIAGQLSVSLENARLYESLEKRVDVRTRELQQAQAKLVATARRAGMAEIANNVLHSVGNVLNSVKTSSWLLSQKIGESKLSGLSRAVALMNEHAGQLGQFMTVDPRGKELLRYLNGIVSALRVESGEMSEEIQRLSRNVDHITDIVTTQQSHAGASSMLQMQDVAELLNEALHMNAAALAERRVKVASRFEPLPELPLDRSKLLQVVVNLIANACDAMAETAPASRRLTLGAGFVHGGGRLRITVKDEGAGITPAHLPQLFVHGFTTKKAGHGFGLHGSAVAAREMGGTLTAHSEGAGHGATFTLELPVQAGEERSAS